MTKDWWRWWVAAVVLLVASTVNAQVTQVALAWTITEDRRVEDQAHEVYCFEGTEWPGTGDGAERQAYTRGEDNDLVIEVPPRTTWTCGVQTAFWVSGGAEYEVDPDCEDPDTLENVPCVSGFGPEGVVTFRTRWRSPMMPTGMQRVPLRETRPDRGGPPPG